MSIWVKLHSENNELKELIQESVLKIRYFEELLIKQSERFAILNKYSIELANQKDEKVSYFIVNEFKSFFKVKEVWILTYDEKNSELVLKDTTLSEKDNAKVIQHLGKSIIGFRTHVDATQYNTMVELGIGEPSSLHDISFGQIPVVISSALEKLFRMGWFQGITLTNRGKLYGALVVAGYKGQDKLQMDELRIFTEITSNILQRKRVEEGLKKKSQLLRDTGEMAKVGGWELDLSSKEVSWTEEVGRIHGVGPGYKPKLEEALNFYAPESRPAVEEVVKKAAETGEPYDLEFLIIPSGSKDKIWVRSLGKAIYSDGKIVKLAGTFQNIDKYKRAEEALRERKEFAENLIASMQDGFSVLDSDGVHIDVNDAFCQMTGFSREELIGVGLPYPYWPREAYEETKNAFQKTLRGEINDLELTFMRKNGEHFPVIVSPFWVKDKQGNVTSYFATVKDISERKRAEIQIQYQANLLANVSDAILATDRQFNIQYWNTAAEKQYGWTSAEVLGSHFMNFIQPKYISDSRRIVMQKIVQEGFWNGELLHNRRDGTRFPVQVTISEVRNAKGQIIGHVTINRDITERKQVGEALHLEKENFRHSLDDSPLGVRIVSGEGETIYANQTILNFYGYDSLEELQNTPLKKRYTPESYAEAQKRKQQRDRGDFSTINYEISIVRKNGEIRYLVAFRKKVLWNDIWQFQVIYHDITERKQAAENLRRKEEHYRAVIENIFKFVPEGLLVFTRNLNLIKQNKAFEEIVQKYAERLDYTKEELAEKIIEQLRGKILAGDTTEIHIPGKDQ